MTHPLTARLLLRGQLGALRERGFEVTLGCAPGPELEGVAQREGVAVRELPLEREIVPLRDLRALLAIRRLIRELRPAVVVAGTPKAGLLGMLAAAMQRVPVRIYVLRGLRLETATGARRALLWTTERIACACATQVLAVSPSLRACAVQLGLAPADRVKVPAHGSSNGVDVEALTPAATSDGEAVRTRRELGLPEAAPVVGFVGRLVADKGVSDLIEAMERHVRPRLPEARLLLVGAHERGDPLPAGVLGRLGDCPWIAAVGHHEDLGPIFRAMDVVALPSYREGFPNVPLEAAACGRPVVGYAVTGTVDAIVDGSTGALVSPGAVDRLGQALLFYLLDPELAAAHGQAGRERAVRDYRREDVQAAWCDAIAAEAQRSRNAR